VASWQELDDELSKWRAAGETASFWWRDDDAVAPTDALDRLISLTQRHGLALHLAVIPVGATPALADRLRATDHVTVLQHGCAHINHQPKGQGASEFGNDRPLDLQRRDLVDGWQRLGALDLPRLLPVLAAPWNRVSDATLPLLAKLGYRGVSTNLSRKTWLPVAGLGQVNVHADPIRWKKGVDFRGEGATLACIVEHLIDRRTGRADKDEPTGITTHHLQTMPEAWAFLDALCERLAFQGVAWPCLSDLLPNRDFTELQSPAP
jgi:hypothetical protein